MWSETEESLAPTRAQARSFCRRRPKVGASRACLLSESGSQARQTARETRPLPCARRCPNVPWSLALDRRRPIRSFRCSHTCVHRPCMSLPDSTTRLCLCYCEPTTRAPRASTGPWATQLCSSSQPRAVWPTGIEAGQGKAGTHALRASLREEVDSGATYSSLDDFRHVSKDSSYRKGGLDGLVMKIMRWVLSSCPWPQYDRKVHGSLGEPRGTC